MGNIPVLLPFISYYTSIVFVLGCVCPVLPFLYLVHNAVSYF